MIQSLKETQKLAPGGGYMLRLVAGGSGTIEAFEHVRLLGEHGIRVRNQEMEVLLARYRMPTTMARYQRIHEFLSLAFDFSWAQDAQSSILVTLAVPLR